MCVNRILAHHVVSQEIRVRRASKKATAARWIWGFCAPDLEALLHIEVHQSLSTPALSLNQDGKSEKEAHGTLTFVLSL
jgi:hypothetical protein